MAGARERPIDGMVARPPSGAGTRRSLLALPPPQWAWLLTAGAALSHGLTFGSAAPWGRSAAAGAALVAGGLAWMGWAAWLFRQVDTPIRPTASPRRFIDGGPFALGRNPMYLGMALAMAGIGLGFGVPGMAAAVVAFVSIVSVAHIPHEEAALERAFGGWYSDYAERVRRWF